MILNEQKKSFQQDYLAFLEDNGNNNDELLSGWLTVALLDPGNISKLRSVYLSIHSEGDFAKYWLTSIESTGQPAPAIAASMLHESGLGERGDNQWRLLDFWGTWCRPCREEHPDLQSFYEKTILPNPDKISLLTIASNDTKARVTKYMTEQKLSFPVAMSDNQIEKDFTVSAFPTKLLITPGGKYIRIPFGIDWINFVKGYVGL